MSISDPNNWQESGRSASEYSMNWVILGNFLFMATIAWILVNSVTTRPAPNSLQTNLSAGSLTPAMGDRKSFEVKRGSLDMENIIEGVILKDLCSKSTLYILKFDCRG